MARSWVRVDDGKRRNFKHGTLLKLKVRFGLGARDFVTDMVEIDMIGAALTVKAACYPGAEKSIWARREDILAPGQECDCPTCQ